MKDSFERNINYMRISITDRCNLRCKYCMPEGIDLLPMERILTLEEIETVVRAAVRLGIRRIKITGGEPLVRKGCPELIRKLKHISGIEQVTLTTNGVLLGKYIEELVDAGLDAVNVSLDTLNAENYKRITGFDHLTVVLNSIEEAITKGLRVKVNAVLQRGYNEHEIYALAELAKNKKLDVRFIELMPIGYGDETKGISNEEVVHMLQKKYPQISADDSFHGNGPAVYYHIPGFQGGIGLISAMFGKFCDKCNRIRMTAQGYLKPCLCYSEGIDLFDLLRSDTEDKEERLVEQLKKAIEMKPDGHVFDDKEKISENRKMIQIGG